MRAVLFLPVLIILALVRAIFHTAEYIWPVKPVKAVANWSARVLRELVLVKAKVQTAGPFGEVSR